MIANVDSLSDRDISLVRPPDDQVTDVYGRGLPPRNTEFGGMSGGPVLTMLEKAGIVSRALAGVIYESSAYFEILRAVRADVIDPKGEQLFGVLRRFQ